MRPELLVAVLVLPVFAGCAVPMGDAAPLAREGYQARTDVTLGEVLDLEIPLSDGVVLRGRAFLPDAPGPHATILEAGPYWWNFVNMDHLQDAENDTLEGQRGNYSRAGFAWVVVGLRGTGTSDGCYAFMNMQDGPDVAAAIEWIAAQPWSDGNIGMAGQSYNGWTQDVVVATGPPSALKAIVSVSGMPDLWSMATDNGHPNLWAVWPELWTAGTALNAFAIASHLGPNPYPHAPPVVASHLCDETAVAADQTREIAEGRKGPAMRGIDLREALADSTVPAVRTVGLAGDGHIQIAQFSWDLMPSPRRLVVGQYGHATPVSQMPDWHDQMIAFYDHHLRGGPQPFAEDRVDYQDDALVWRTADAWPPTERVAVLYAAAGALTLEPGADASTRAVFCCRVAADLSPCDYGGAVFVSPPLVHDVTFAGTPRLDLTVTSTSPQDLVSGLVLRTQDADVCASATSRPMSPFLGDLRHAKDHETPSDFPVGAPSLLWLDGRPFATTVRAGERIALVFSGHASVLTLQGGDRSTVTLPIAVGELKFDVADARP